MNSTARAFRRWMGGSRCSRTRLALFAAVLVVVGVSPGGHAPAAAGVLVIPSSIDASGATNVSAKLLAYFASVPDGSTIQFPKGASYRSDEPLTLVDRNRLTFEGNGATVFATPGTGDRGRRHWWFQGGSAITIRNLTVKGANPEAGTGNAAYQEDMEAQHGFDFSGVAGVQLDRVRVTDVYGDFVYLGKRSTTWTSGAWIHDSHFERNGRQGIALTGAEDVLIERNFISQTRRATFDFEPNGHGWGVRDVTITNNDVGPGRLLFVSAHGSGPVDDITISGNRLTGKSMVSSFNPPIPTRRANLRFINNVSDRGYGSSSGRVIYITSTTGITVTGNVQPLQDGRDMVGVQVISGCDVNVSGNTFLNEVGPARIHLSPDCP